MSKRNIAFVVGTRPEAIKLAPVIIESKKHDDLNPIICCTGQHREMLIQALDVFGLVPDYNLDLMTENQNLTSLTTRAIEGISELFSDIQANQVVVQGDTTTAFSGALSAFYKSVPVLHIEAGLRTNNIYSPWPEEMNRMLISRLASHHFAPTEWARQNLLREGISPKKISVTGNTVIDALKWTAHNSIVRPHFWDTGFEQKTSTKKILLVTTHRRENLDGTIENICRAINKLAKRKDIYVVLPVHFNPNVRSAINKTLDHLDNVQVTDPLDYREFVFLLKHCYLVITDSGGIQEEAPALGKPVLVVRDTTERPEAVEAGTAMLVGKDETAIYNAAIDLLERDDNYKRMSLAKNPYGDGTASLKIVDHIIKSV
jgi:UDP-N-acetylglucosamine 2-epimerase (non-hydrolysing)